MDDYNLFINTTLRSLRFGRMDNLTTIGASFLENCKGLDSIDLGILRNASQVVGGSFLSDCIGLKSIDLTPLRNITSVGDNFLSGCKIILAISSSSQYYW